MSRRTTQLLKVALSAMHYSGAGRLASPYVGGDGVILMLHQVTPEARRDFEPNGILKVTPAFLESVIEEVRAAGFEMSWAGRADTSAILMATRRARETGSSKSPARSASKPPLRRARALSTSRIRRP
jgi:hypothetical protein